MALRLASSSLARRLLSNRVSRSYTNLAAVRVVGRSNGVCAAHENGRRELNAAATMKHRFNWRFMATSAAQEQEDDNDDDDDADIDLEVQEANERWVLKIMCILNMPLRVFVFPVVSYYLISTKCLSYAYLYSDVQDMFTSRKTISVSGVCLHLVRIVKAPSSYHRIFFQRIVTLSMNQIHLRHHVLTPFKQIGQSTS